MNCKAILTTAAAGAVLSVFSAVPAPEVSVSGMSQDSKGVATISYTLSAADAVVTLDIETNATGNVWASIGGAAVSSAQGDVWKKVEPGSRTIKWNGSTCWADGKIPASQIRAVVTAWSLDNPPDYMVVDISAGAQPNTQRYYPSVDFLPGSEPGQKGAVTNNTAYRLTSLLMRKIMAKDICWTMGNTALEKKVDGAADAREATHQVTLTNNYYIGVFEITQSQWAMIQSARPAPSFFCKPGECAMRPVERVSYNEIRNNDGTSAAENSAYNWPADPNPASFLGILRSRTGIAFDLPCESQWEFAARAGNGTTLWGDGSAIGSNVNSDANYARLGRYAKNGGKNGDASIYSDTGTDTTYGPEMGTAYAGSYSPNDWGIYDMSGNVAEWCLDYYEDDIATATDTSGRVYGGRVNIDPTNGAKCLSGNDADTDSSGTKVRVLRGGNFNQAATYGRPGCRDNRRGGNTRKETGFRVVCNAEMD